MPASILAETLSSLLQHIQQNQEQLSRQCYEYYEYGPLPKLPFKDVPIDELVLEWLDPLLENLMHLIRCNDPNLPVFAEDQIKVAVEKLRSLRNFLEIAGKELEAREEYCSKEGLLAHIRFLIQDAIYLSYDSWIRKERARMKKLFFDFLVKMNDIEPEIRMIYVQLLKASKIANPSTLGIELQALAAVDSLLDNLQKLLNDQDSGYVLRLNVQHIDLLHQDLSFLKYFLMDPQLRQHTKPEPVSFFNSFLEEVEAMARKGASLTDSILFGQTKDNVADKMNMLHLDLMTLSSLKFGSFKFLIRQMYHSVQKPSTSSFPQTPKLAFLDFFLQRLDEMLKHGPDSIAYVKNEIETVQGELAQMYSFMRDTIKDPKSLADENIARDTINVAYEAELVIDLISTSHFPRWYYMLWLSDVIENVKLLRNEKEFLRKESTEVSNFDQLIVEKASVHYRPQAFTLIDEEDMVGFNDEAEKIIDQLIQGPKELNIVSIVGISGLGKTTLAKKVYEHPSITRHFHVQSWCCIGQLYEKQELLFSILRRVTNVTEKTSHEDMAEMLYRSLKGRRYLIVIDDIWSAEPWNDMRISFPNDCNGSRILFTSQNSEVARHANPRSDPHFLRFFLSSGKLGIIEEEGISYGVLPPYTS